MNSKYLSFLFVPMLGLGLSACDVETSDGGDPARAEVNVNEQSEQVGRAESEPTGSQANVDIVDRDINVEDEQQQAQAPEQDSAGASANVELNRQETTVEAPQPAESETEQQASAAGEDDNG